MQLFGGKKDPKHTPDGPKPGAPIDSGKDTKYGMPPTSPPEDFTDREEKTGNRRWLKVTLIVAAVLVLIVAGAYIGLQIWMDAPDVNVGGPTTHAPQTSGEPNQVEPTMEPAEAPDQISSGNRRSGTYTFAIIGTDVVSNSTDTIMVGMLDTVEGKLNVVSIPRDTLVNTGYDRKKINYIYPANLNNGKDGLQPLLNTIEDILGYPVDSYAVVDIEVCAAIVDAIGGVWFDVPVDMDWDAWDQDYYIHIKAGYQKLNGEDAVKVMRFRYSNDGTNTYAGGDIDRLNVQHDLLMELAKQTLTLGNIPNLGKLISIYENNVTTNVTARNLAYYAQEFLKLSPDDITFQTMPANYWGSLYGEGYCFPYIDDWLEMINGFLNPFDTEITRANLDMLYSDGVSVYSTTGSIRGGIESFYGYIPS